MNFYQILISVMITMSIQGEISIEEVKRIDEKYFKDLNVAISTVNGYKSALELKMAEETV